MNIVFETFDKIGDVLAIWWTNGDPWSRLQRIEKQLKSLKQRNNTASMLVYTYFVDLTLQFRLIIGLMANFLSVWPFCKTGKFYIITCFAYPVILCILYSVYAYFQEQSRVDMRILNLRLEKAILQKRLEMLMKADDDASSLVKNLCEKHK